jgi:uncharacterized surface protein with fasciclin (FAS1) repeats
MLLSEDSSNLFTSYAKEGRPLNSAWSEKMRKLTVLLVALLLMNVAYAADKKTKGSGGKDIVDTAIAAGSFNRLAKALQAAALVETLKGAGPFTVFAPTDEAFAKLPAGTVEDLLKPENQEKLRAVLTYHVVPGKVMAEQAMKLNSAKTVNGKEVTIKTEDGKVMINDATVTKADVGASNGVIHVIDTVLLP